MIARTAGAIALLVPLLSALTSPAVPLAFRAVLVLLWLVAVLRPHWAIAALIAIVPFSSWLLLVTSSPQTRYAEALVLATLSGLLIASARSRRNSLRAQRPDLGTPALVFSAIVIASAAVTLTLMQTGTHAPLAFVRQFLTFLMHDYLVAPPGAFPGVADGALLLEGLALLVLAGRQARDHVARPGQLLAATALACTAAALLTAITWLVDASAAASAGDAMRLLLKSRTSVHVNDLNAAGSAFAMGVCLALGFAVNRRWARTPRRPSLTRVLWGSAAALLLLGVWLTGSRMAILATIASVGAAVIDVSPFRARRMPKWAMTAAAVAAVAILVALALGLDPRPSAARTASNMLTMRADFMITGLRMMRSAPVFGVGIGRYFEESGRFMPPSIYWFYFHENAHNNLLQIGGELGLAGVAAFLWLLIAAGLRLARGLRADPGDRLLLGAAAGLGAFVITWLTSHPLLQHEVAYPFWILLGVAIARADGNVQAALAAPAFVNRAARPMRVVAAAAILALAVSVPLRARQAIAQLDLAQQSWGFYAWEGQGADRARWTSRHATFFIPSAAHELRLPIRALHFGPNTGPTSVTIAVGGRPFHRLDLPNSDWTIVRLRLPVAPRDEAFQRIDVITDPTWSPAAIYGGRSDVRVLGVLSGEPAVAP